MGAEALLIEAKLSTEPLFKVSKGNANGRGLISPVQPSSVWVHGDEGEARYENESNKAEVPRRAFKSYVRSAPSTQ